MGIAPQAAEPSAAAAIVAAASATKAREGRNSSSSSSLLVAQQLRSILTMAFVYKKFKKMVNPRRRKKPTIR
ncbi:hypothetical protein ACOMHN_003449 [Nucella lapillus]